MPLDKSDSKAAFSHNVSAEIHAGKPQNQAVAIAYAVKRRAEGHVHHDSVPEQHDYLKGGSQQG